MHKALAGSGLIPHCGLREVLDADWSLDWSAALSLALEPRGPVHRDTATTGSDRRAKCTYDKQHTNYPLREYSEIYVENVHTRMNKCEYAKKLT